ncbi:TetR/AcrR family transcriptional regulator [Actinomadura algeriensis]|uniref:AcrR family transcriptional regulator n=1 Tax=Actinomadura algeriensis TaxID=1679523 RepID=A0ABR9JPF7_9ACTN|nr:TetR/AcrR family transcriptional regulator [Actinomadura algeriensis]MBE1532446.1 AcrR family transcriptional regulator [Actinomadura algeriensis]
MSDAGHVPGTVRPGGRTARIRTAVLRAAEDALIECGFAGVDLAEIARRAEVGKTTVYRRWGTPQGLVADLLADMADQSVRRTETGALADDLRANARLVLRTLTDPRQGVLFKAVISAAAGDARTAEALHRFYAARIAEWSPCVEQAIVRGEAPDGTDAAEVVRAVSAPLYYRFLVSGDPLDETVADQSAHAAACAAGAGAYVR